MPFPRRFSETLFRASLYLLVIVIPFTTMAIPVITQDYTRSSTPATATNTVSSKLTDKGIFDIVFALLFFLLIFGCLALVGGFPFPPFVVIDWLDAAFRPIKDTVSSFQLRALFRRKADAVVGSDGARPAPQMPDDGTSPTRVPASSSLRVPTQDVELHAPSTAPRCASSATDDSGVISPSSA